MYDLFVHGSKIERVGSYAPQVYEFSVEQTLMRHPSRQINIYKTFFPRSTFE